ncbi:hypothetical protein N7456_002260 [Penicillium angulare]|uniref:Uncharacterized protein n=1 Tax=Penicillium angulare TaxID=116970 RepID=A0A9W9G7U9_9EURO|nr:hypothetical protein N7456_002260 [Penicillium angulare]
MGARGRNRQENIGLFSWNKPVKEASDLERILARKQVGLQSLSEEKTSVTRDTGVKWIFSKLERLGRRENNPGGCTESEVPSFGGLPQWKSSRSLESWNRWP